MPIISAKDNENNRWKRNTKTKKHKKTEKGGRKCEACYPFWYVSQSSFQNDDKCRQYS